jgi:hypothetical protein
MANIVRVDYRVLGPTGEVDGKGKPVKRRVRVLAANAHSRHSLNAHRQFPNDGFIPMEEIVRQQQAKGVSGSEGSGKTLRGAGANGNGNKSWDLSSDVLNAARKLSNVGLSSHIERERESEGHHSEEHSCAGLEHMRLKSHAVAAHTASKRQTPFGRFVPPPPVWQFSGHVDRDSMLFDFDASLRRYQSRHAPAPQPKRPVSVKEQWLHAHSAESMTHAQSMALRDALEDEQWPLSAREHQPHTESDSRHRPGTAPALRGTTGAPAGLKARDYHETYQPVREAGLLSARERLNPKTSGKVANHSLPLYPSLRERLDHGIHADRWNVMTVESDDADRLLPVLHRPGKSHEDFEHAYLATRLVRGEAVATTMSIDAVRSMSQGL